MSEHSNKSGSSRSASKPNPVHQSISRKLREFYDSVREEAIPEHFLDLLERLDQADNASRGENTLNPGEK
jgi:Anti-sigma factor NepR